MSMDDGVKRIAYGYTRVSTEEQTFGASLENQRLAIQKYARQNNIEIIVFDMNVSGNIAKAINHPEIGTLITKK